jgi:hypothetical protein
VAPGTGVAAQARHEPPHRSIDALITEPPRAFKSGSIAICSVSVTSARRGVLAPTNTRSSVGAIHETSRTRGGVDQDLAVGAVLGQRDQAVRNQALERHHAVDHQRGGIARGEDRQRLREVHVTHVRPG